MKYLGVRLKPKSFLHLGDREGWLEGSRVHIPSDTLFSALCHCHLLLYGEADSFIDAFKGAEPPFIFSSAFPYWGSELYFPLPKNQLAKDKFLKKIKYVNASLLIRLLNGECLEDLKDEIEINQALDCLPRLNGSGKQAGGLVPWRVEDVPRVSLNRFNNHPGENFFYFGQVSYVEDAGLFVLLKNIKKGWEDKINSLFRLLCDEGVGGDRSAGKGLFHQPEMFELEIPQIDKPGGLYALSAYFPRENELIDIESGFYELEERKGYIFSPANRSYRRRSIRLFSEGSVFAGLDKKGSLVDITPAVFEVHRIYRYGLLFSFPCKLEET
ncbi:MAG: type III-A CRISPR-associated RAMP protein Csm4 [Candidatus Aminicenantes bacterium]|nr:type III-A CRISPR-associated RAMP protein Csm4 [Candidatus Aminicenantes bacterium]